MTNCGGGLRFCPAVTARAAMRLGVLGGAEHDSSRGSGGSRFSAVSATAPSDNRASLACESGTKPCPASEVLALPLPAEPWIVRSRSPVEETRPHACPHGYGAFLHERIRPPEYWVISLR